MMPCDHIKRQNKHHKNYRKKTLKKHENTWLQLKRVVTHYYQTVELKASEVLRVPRKVSKVKAAHHNKNCVSLKCGV